MKVDIKKLDKIKRKVKVEVSGVKFHDKWKEVCSSIGKKLKVPGFRPGNAPIDVLKKHHGKILREEFLQNVLPFYYRQVLEENNIVAVGMPHIYDVDLSDNGLVFCADFEIRPQIKIEDTDYKRIKIKDNVTEVTELEVQKALTGIKDRIKDATQRDFLDDDLAKWSGYPDVERLKIAVRAQLFIEKLRERRQNIDGQISRYLLKNIKVEVSSIEVEQQQKDLVDREVYNLQLRGVSQEDIDKYKKDIKEKAKPIASDQVKLSYIISTIAKQENIKTENNLGEIVLGFILSQAKYE